jgi:hypothetical protein
MRKFSQIYFHNVVTMYYILLECLSNLLSLKSKLNYKLLERLRIFFVHFILLDNFLEPIIADLRHSDLTGSKIHLHLLNPDLLGPAEEFTAQKAESHLFIERRG